MVHVTGDGFTALFGAPVAQEDHTQRAVLAALELRQHLHAQPLLSVLTWGEAVLACIGVHTRSAVVGRLQHEPQWLYTAVSASTHLALPTSSTWCDPGLSSSAPQPTRWRRWRCAPRHAGLSLDTHHRTEFRLPSVGALIQLTVAIAMESGEALTS